ncbi:claudin-4-like [Gadus morhua]|uniref:Claudin 30 n=1 Tax=Gadus morhua TaxID=8049 RepID=A0A8C5CV37_GADMO|nr:claudin-4-like [Gadus morhua]
MASLGIQMLASALALMGWAGAILGCVMPLWRVTAFVGSTIVTSQTIWEGIWMSCVCQSTGQISCKPYQSMLALSSDLQAARTLTVLAILTGAAGLLLAFIGGKCTRFLDDAPGRSKVMVVLAAGGVLIAAGLLLLIPSSWTAASVVSKFYSASNDAQRREMGASLYIGWAASVMLILGGALLIGSSCPLRPPDDDKRSGSAVRYVAVRVPTGSGRTAPRTPVSPPALQGSAKLPWGEGSARSEGSKALSTKSQLERPGSTRSEQSSALSTKSQLKRAAAAAADASLESVKTEGSEDARANAVKSYL